MWNTPPSRRKNIPMYSNTLSRSNTRMTRCETCRKLFANTDDLRRHVRLNHTGKKPIVCPICEKRFQKEGHMLSHYEMHKEPRLQEFAILTKRGVSKPKPELNEPSSVTTVGSFRNIPRELLFRDNSFGTKQSFIVSEKKDTYNKTNQQNQNKKDIQKKDESVLNSRNKSESYSTRLPRLDGSAITVLGSVMGTKRTIETNERSRFLQSAENKLIEERIEAVNRANKVTSRHSVQTPSAYSEPRFDRQSVNLPQISTNQRNVSRLSQRSLYSENYSLPALNGAQRKSAYSNCSRR